MSDTPSRSSSVTSSGPRRSQGHIVVARSLWYVKPGVAELRTERLAAPRPGEARVATLFSAVSRGTERVVANGDVPESEWTRMRAPLQTGAFPYPVKYGYSATGIVTNGSDALLGKTVFCLHPHQDHFQVAEDMLTVVPDSIPARRATLAANIETALNAHWDAGTMPGDKVLVVGAGIVGLLTAYIAQRIAGTSVAITDIDIGRAGIAEKLGLKFAAPDSVPNDNAITFHTSASGAGLDTALNATAFEGRVIELSWYGSRPATVRLGGAFHSRRLQIISSQVGHVAASRRANVSLRQRLQTAISLLDDARLDNLVSDVIPFGEAAERIHAVFNNPIPGGCAVFTYPSH